MLIGINIIKLYKAEAGKKNYEEPEPETGILFRESREPVKKRYLLPDFFLKFEVDKP